MGLGLALAVAVVISRNFAGHGHQSLLSALEWRIFGLNFSQGMFEGWYYGVSASGKIFTMNRFQWLELTSYRLSDRIFDCRTWVENSLQEPGSNGSRKSASSSSRLVAVTSHSFSKFLNDGKGSSSSIDAFSLSAESDFPFRPAHPGLSATDAA